MSKEDSAGRMSWDETAVLAAVTGYRSFYKIKTGRIIINDDGSNTWSSKGSKQYYLVEDKPVQQVQNLINSLIMHQPE